MSPQTSSSLPSASAAPAVAELVAAGHDTDAEAYERAHVHGVYEAIAPHFSSTRYKPWPAVAHYLHVQPPGSVGLDVGCGNGKYLGVNPAVCMLGSDRSSNLVALAASHAKLLEKGGVPVAEDNGGVQGGKKSKGKNKKKQQQEESAGEVADANSTNSNAESKKPPLTTDVLVADGLSLPFRDRSADFAICVAVIHHLSTRARRQDAIRQLLKCVRRPEDAGAAPEDIGRGGTILVYVWALEQGNSRRGWDEGGEQDLLVPWVMKKSQAQVKEKQKTGSSRPSGQGPEREGDAVAAVTASRGNSGEQQQQDSSTPSADAANPSNSTNAGQGEAIAADGKGADQKTTDPDPSTVFNRYYHLYRKGELEEDVLAVGGVVIKSGYERDNWWVVAANSDEPSP